MFFSTQLVLHRVKSQDNRGSERKGQTESNPHCTKKLCHQKSKPDGFVCHNDTLRTLGITQIPVDTYLSDNRISDPSK